MTQALIVPAIGQTLSLTEAKAHLRIDHDDDDALVQSLIATATDHLERTTGICLLTQTWRLYLDAWPEQGLVKLPGYPVTAISEIRVYDGDGQVSAEPVAWTLDSAARPARLMVTTAAQPGQMLNGIEIDFQAGFGDTGADVPDSLKRALLLHIALMHEFSGAVANDQQPAAIPAGWDRLVAPFMLKGL